MRNSLLFIISFITFSATATDVFTLPGRSFPHDGMLFRNIANYEIGAKFIGCGNTHTAGRILFDNKICTIDIFKSDTNDTISAIQLEWIGNCRNPAELKNLVLHWNQLISNKYTIEMTPTQALVGTNYCSFSFYYSAEKNPVNKPITAVFASGHKEESGGQVLWGCRASLFICVNNTCSFTPVQFMNEEQLSHCKATVDTLGLINWIEDHQKKLKKD